MKKLLGVLALATAGTACQPQATTDTGLGTKASETAIAVAQSAPASPPVELIAASTDSLTAAVLAQHNLATVLRTTIANPDETAAQPMNGFFGPDNHRIEIVFTKAQRDAQQLGRYLVQGKDRFKDTITPLAGTVNFTKVRARTDAAVNSNGQKIRLVSYALLGDYELREDPHALGAGVFQGHIAIDAMLDEDGKLITESVDDSASRGGIIMFDGTWTNSTTGQRKSAVWVANLFNYRGPQLVNDFFIGERERSINPKYAKLGWNKYWENDEWWADSPKLALRH